ncbi:MAG: pyridoxamine 5'-phosphate oxidase family protein [Chloroflexi bacterium]|nr:pyridoxamine 5'-phosphate oxidase family protein [Chloroflexota bacterium]
MDTQTLQSLSHLLRTLRIAALGTLPEGAPFVSLILYAEAPDFSAFYLHLSRLAVHTRAIQSDPRVGLMIAQPDLGSRNPQTLARVSIQGEARALPKDAPSFETAKSLYLTKFPEADFNFTLDDFDLYCLAPRLARFVADFGKIYDLGEEDFREAGTLASVNPAQPLR